MNAQEIKYIEDEIKRLRREISSDYFEIIMDGDGYEKHFDKTEIQDKRTWIYERLKDLYLLICSYIEIMELPDYLVQFRNKFSTVVYDRKEAMQSASPLYSESEPYLVVLYAMEEFITPFKTFDSKYKDDERINILEEVLKNTNHIIKKAKLKSISEPEIYKEVRWILNITHPSAKAKNKARFIKKFGTYHPDILIPEIKSAVEYKYIRKGKNVGTYIGQIKNDADDYVHDFDYENFYAVMYFEDSSITTEKAVLEEWKAKKFPKNWKPIIVFG